MITTYLRWFRLAVFTRMLRTLTLLLVYGL